MQLTARVASTPVADVANATMRHNIERACREAGYEPPVICTPEELTNDHED